MSQYFRHCVFRRLRDSRGATLLEAAIVTPLLLIFTFGIMDFALLLWVWLALQNGASLATRQSITANPTPASIRAAMRDATPALTLDDGAFTFSHISPGGAVWVAGVGGPNDIGKVTVRYTWTLVTPVVSPFFSGGKVNFVVESAMKNENWNP
jgi:Flp pilus assembly protein TadG